MIEALAMYVMCSWNNPGHDPYVGDTIQAVDSFTIPKHARAEIKYKILKNTPDDVIEIGKYSVESKKYSFNPNMLLMHFGKNKLCWGVDRSKWDNNHVEKAPIYCSSTYCVAIPYVCNNVTQLFSKRDIERVPPIVEKEKVHTVPEPSTLYLLGLALISVVCRRKVLSIYQQ